MSNAQQNAKILIYTRKPVKEYTESLSNSIHLAYSDGQGDFTPLHQNYGVLFTLAAIDSQNVIQEKGLKNPYIFRTENGSFGIIAVRVDKKGNDDPESKGQVLLWTSEDLISFNYCGLLKLHDELYVREAVCEYNEDNKNYEIHWQDNEGSYYVNTIKKLSETKSVSLPAASGKYSKEQPVINLTDINPGNILEVDAKTGKAIQNHWTPVYNTEIELPDNVSIASEQELAAIKATAHYSDGSTALKLVKWNSTAIDFSKPGAYTVEGQVQQKTYPFPLTSGYADPVILPWNNKYYYLATNDNVNDIGIFVREGDTIMELFNPGFKESIILNVDEEKNFIQTFWAPEFHIIGGELYILFAVGGKRWAPHCHMMKLKKGGDIMKAEDWETPVRVRRADGTDLAPDGISLDMTYFKADGISCVVWSYRKGIGTPLDTGSMLYIATIDENNPTVLTSEPVLLTRPLYGWENIQGTINNEGPYALVTDDMVYITYSGGAAGGYTYALGLMSIPRGSDYLDISAWKKATTPVLSYYSINGIYGPGHNSFFKDYDGDVMIMYHGEVKIASSHTRCTAMHRVHFGINNVPIFNMSKERDLDPAHAMVSLQVTVK
jgi:GH43 family beta-xylosidase